MEYFHVLFTHFYEPRLKIFHLHLFNSSAHHDLLPLEERKVKLHGFNLLGNIIMEWIHKILILILSRYVMFFETDLKIFLILKAFFMFFIFKSQWFEGFPAIL